MLGYVDIRRYSVLVLMLITSLWSCQDENTVGDPVASGVYRIDNQSSCDITCSILNSNRNIFISSSERVEIATESCFCGSLKTPASLVVGDLIFYRDSMGIEVEAYNLIPSSDFDTRWVFEYLGNDSTNAKITLIVTDDMVK